MVEGAHEGVGLGIQFLKHIERCKALIHLIDVTNENLENTYQQVRNELINYSKDLLKKKEIIILNKTDLLNDVEVKKIVNNFSKNKNSKFVLILTKKKCKDYSGVFLSSQSACEISKKFPFILVLLGINV